MTHNRGIREDGSIHAVAGGLLRSRGGIVVGAFSFSMLVLSGVLLALDGPNAPAVGGRTIAPLAAPRLSVPLETILQPPAGLDRQRWDRIVIHHSRSRFGDPAQIAREHERLGLAGMGYHFVIGNGRGMADGELHIGSRWLGQQPGAHVAGANSLDLNRTSIGVCLVGDGRSERFGRQQLDRLVDSVVALARGLDIPISRINLHQDLAGVVGPGPFFPRERFYRRLADAGIPAR